MSALRVTRAAARARIAPIRAQVQRRGYADAVSDKIKLSLALPHQVRERAVPKCQPAAFQGRSILPTIAKALT